MLEYLLSNPNRNGTIERFECKSDVVVARGGVSLNPLMPFLEGYARVRKILLPP